MAHAATLGLLVLVPLVIAPQPSADARTQTQTTRQVGADEAGASSEPQAAQLLRVRHEARAGSTWIVLEGSGPLAYSYSSTTPRDAVLELPGVSATSLPSVVEIGTPEVESIQLSELDPASQVRGLRVEVHLPQPVRHRVFPTENDLNLVFTQSRARAARRDMQLSEDANAPAAAASNPAAPESPASPTAVTGAPVASSIVAVSVEPGEKTVTIAVRADGQLSYEDFLTDVPVRLVVDFAGVTNRVEQSALPVGRGAIRRVDVVQQGAEPALVTRLVVDLHERVGYQILKRANGVAIVLELRPGRPEQE